MTGRRITNRGLTGKAVKALSVFGGTQVVGVLCSVVRTKFIAVLIGPVGVGLFAIYNSVIEMVAGATQLSMRQTAVRDVAQALPSEVGGIAASVRWWGRRLGLVGAAVMLAASPLLSLASFGDASRWWAFASLSACMLFMSVTGAEQALMQGTGRLSALAKSMVCASVIGTALSLPLFYFFGEGGIVPSLMLFSLTALVCAVGINDVPSRRQTSMESRERGRGFLRLGVSMTISSLAATGMSYAFLSYLTQVAGEDATGIYQAGYTLTVKYVGLVFTALAMDYYPRLSSLCHRRRMTSVFISHQASLLMCVIAPMVVIFVSADSLFLRLLYSGGFMAALPMMAISIGGVVFRALSYCYAYLIVARGDGKVYILTEVTSCAIGLSLNIIGYRCGGLAGVGLSYVVWYVIYTVMCREVCRRRYGVDISRRAWAISAWSIIIVGTAICFRLAGWWQPLLLLPATAMLALYAWRRR